MATASDIQAVLADALANDISWADLATLVKRALINSVVESSTSVVLPWKTVGSDGTTLTRESAEALLRLCARMSGGGVVPQLAEFRAP